MYKNIINIKTTKDILYEEVVDTLERENLNLKIKCVSYQFYITMIYVGAVLAYGTLKLYEEFGLDITTIVIGFADVFVIAGVVYFGYMDLYRRWRG